MDQLSLGLPVTNVQVVTNQNLFDDGPQLVHQSNNVAIYRQNDVGIKVLHGFIPSEEKTMRLAHEKDISNFLPSSCHKREVFHVQSFNGSPAMYFKWCHGITLKQWLKNSRARDGLQVDLGARVRAAIAVANTLHEFHVSGVTYNNLSLENIAFDISGDNYAATFIDLSKAVFMDTSHLGSEVEFARENKDKDLHDLGRILNDLFIIGDDSAEERTLDRTYVPDDSHFLPNNSQEESTRRKRGKQQMAGEGLPLYLVALISSLHVKGDGRILPTNLCYSSALDVSRDLNVLIEKADVLKQFQEESFTSRGRLRLNRDMFHGRHVEISMLKQLFQSVAVSGKHAMAVIAGSPGAGKSALVKQIRKSVGKRGLFFIEGKFSKVSNPDSILLSALNSFFGRVMICEDENTNITLRWRIHDVIGSGNSPLLEILPNLKKLLKGNATENYAQTENHRGTIGGLCSSHRLKFLICKLIGAIGSHSKPLVLSLDDLQWADETTLEIIQLIMSDPDISHLLLLSCYCDNEINSNDPLMSTLNGIQKQGENNVLKIKLGPLEKDSATSLLSEVLVLPPSLCKSLSSTVHAKTGGIILFILKFLTSLSEEGLLWYSMASRRWVFDLDAISSKDVSEDVVHYMTQCMARLSKQMQMGLKLAACLGTSFPKEVILISRFNVDCSMETLLDSYVDGGFLNDVYTSSNYAWAHDQVHQAAYDLIPVSKRESFHLFVGSSLYMRSSMKEVEKYIFFIVDNMNRGLVLIEGSEQRTDVSSLNLTAGEKAMSTSAFHSAVKYLKTARELLQHESWETNYSLTMKIYNKLIESLFAIGDFSGMMDLIDKPLKHANRFEDKLDAYKHLVRAQAALGQMKEGIEQSLIVLSQLGEDIPDVISAEFYQKEVFQIKHMLNGISHNDILSLPTMSDKNKLSAMEFMNQAISLTFVANPILNPIIVFRMIKMSIEYGVCNLSAFAFGCYGGWLVSVGKSDFDEGHRMGRIATELIKRLDAVEMIPRTYVAINTFINIWKEPFQGKKIVFAVQFFSIICRLLTEALLLFLASMNKHLEAYDVGMSIGDTEYGLSNYLQTLMKSLYGCGVDLERLAKDMQDFVRRAIQYKQMMLAKTAVILVQLAMELMGVDENAYALYFGDVNEPSVFALAHDNKEKSICRIICLKRKYVSFLSGDLDGSAKAFELSQEYLDGTTGKSIALVIGTFIDGLIALYFARKHPADRMKWMRVAESVIETVTQWNLNGCTWNFENKKLLLEAEYHFVNGDYTNASISYEASIKAAKDHRFVHEEGLAFEKAATFFLHNKNHGKALEYFVSAKKCYLLWGADALVKRVEKAITVLSPMTRV